MILSTIWNFIAPHAVSGVVSAVSGIVLWRSLNFAWDNLRPLEIPTKFAVSWAEKKGRAFGTYYRRKLKNAEMVRKTIDALDNSSDAIQDAFMRGVRSGAGL